METGHQLRVARERHQPAGRTRAARAAPDRCQALARPSGSPRPPDRGPTLAADRRAPPAAGWPARRLQPARTTASSSERDRRGVVWKLDVPSCHPHADDRHLSRRQRSRLVRADDGRRSQRLDRRQPAHERLAGAPCVSYPRRAQWSRPPAALRAPPPQPARCPSASIRPIDAPCHAPRPDTMRRDSEGQPDEPPAERIEPPFERRALDVDSRRRACRFGQFPSSLRSRSRRRGRAPRRRSCLCRPCWFDRRAPCRRRAPSRAALETGSDSPVSAASSMREIGRLDQPRVGRHVMAGGELDDVAGHEIVRASMIAKVTRADDRCDAGHRARESPPWRAARAAPSRSQSAC